MASAMIAPGIDDGGLDEERADDVGQDVADHHAQVAGAERPRALHVVLLARSTSTSPRVSRM